MSGHTDAIQPAAILRALGARYGEAVFRTAAVAATSVFVVRAAVAYVASPSRITLLLVLLTEVLSAGLLLFSNVPKTRDTHPVALACVVWAYLYCMLLTVAPADNMLGAYLGPVLCSAGVLLTIWGQVSIGTCFGLLPATRGVVCSGPYRFMRHPIYVGYFLTHLAFLLSNLTLRNVVVLASLYVCQIVRVLREEAVLRQEPAYRAYCDDVPYRFCYGLA